jgi:ferredoxin
LSATLPFDSYDFYLCGPVAFMQALYDGLRHLDVADARIHAEAFGPSSLHRDPVAAPSPVVPARAPARESVPVAFTASGHEARWTPQAGSLLELAEARGLSPAFSCRRGECGTCRTRIVEGAVAYATTPTAAVADGEALICCAVPAAREDGGADRLVLDL